MGFNEIYFDSWRHLITRANDIIDVEFYYMLKKENTGIKVTIGEANADWDLSFGPYPTLEEALDFVKNYKEKVIKLADYEEELFYQQGYLKGVSNENTEV